MILNIAIGAVIFGFAIWSIVRSIRLSRQGKCAGCAAKKNGCASSCQSE